LFQLCFHIAQGHIPPQITHVLRATCLLAMTKLLRGVRSIAMGETIYQFTNPVLCLQFHETFVTHFSTHQFRVATKGGCEIVIHGIMCTLNFHLDWVVLQLDVANTFNSMSRRVIFQKLRATCGDIIQLIHFVHAFYAFKSPLFYSHHNRESDVTIIPSPTGTHQGGLLGGGGGGGAK
jgi:hypothetical protein